MLYEWDSAKAKSNFMKHAVPFADAVAVFEDNSALTIEDDHLGEDRYVTIGMDAVGRVPVVFTHGAGILPVSSRRGRRRSMNAAGTKDDK